MNRSLRKVLFREIRGSFTRFLSIFIMVALGCMFLVGLRSAAPDMRKTSDEYFDRQNFMDIQIMSTLRRFPRWKALDRQKEAGRWMPLCLCRKVIG